MSVMTLSREIKIGFCILLILVFASYLVITFTDDSMDVYCTLNSTQGASGKVSDDGRIWTIDEALSEGDVLTTSLYAKKAGRYHADLSCEVQNTGSYITITGDGILTPDNTLKKEFARVMLEPDIRDYSVSYELDDSCRNVFLTVHYSGSGGLSVSRVRSVSEFVYYRDAGFVCACLLFVVIIILFVLGRDGLLPFRKVFARSRNANENAVFLIRDDGTLRHIDMTVFCVGLGLISSLPAMGKGLYRGADLQFHLMRLKGLADGLASLQLPVRIQPYWFFDAGYPVSVFYPDLLLYPAAALIALGVSEYFVLCAFNYLCNILSTWIATYAFSGLLGSRVKGMMAAACYMLSVYRFINLYNRCDIAEILAMGFMPLVFLGIWEILVGDERRWMILALGFTLIISSHILSVMFAAILCALFTLVMIGRLTLKRIGSLALAAGSTVLLNLWFVLPLFSMAGEPLTILRQRSDISRSVVYLPQMFRWLGSSTGGNIQGSVTEDEMMLSIGFIFGFVLLLWGFFKIKGHVMPEIVDLCVLLAIFFLWISSEFFPWEQVMRIPLIGRILTSMQFSWRFYILATPALAIVSGEVIGAFMSRTSPDRMLLIVIFMAILNVMPLMDHYIEDAKLYFVDKYRFELDLSGERENRDYLYADLKDRDGLSRTIEAEGGEVSDIARRGVNISLAYQRKGAEDMQVVLPLFLYPHFRASVNGKPAKITSDSHHRAVVTIPESAPDNGVVRVYYREPLLWRMAEFISLASLVFFVFTYYSRKRHKISQDFDGMEQIS